MRGQGTVLFENGYKDIESTLTRLVLARGSELATCSTRMRQLALVRCDAETAKVVDPVTDILRTCKASGSVGTQGASLRSVSRGFSIRHDPTSPPFRVASVSTVGNGLYCL